MKTLKNHKVLSFLLTGLSLSTFVLSAPAYAQSEDCSDEADGSSAEDTDDFSDDSSEDSYEDSDNLSDESSASGDDFEPSPGGMWYSASCNDEFSTAGMGSGGGTSSFNNEMPNFGNCSVTYHNIEGSTQATYNCVCADTQESVQGFVDMDFDPNDDSFGGFDDPSKLVNKVVRACKQQFEFHCGPFVGPVGASCTDERGYCHNFIRARGGDNPKSIMEWECECADTSGWGGMQVVDRLLDRSLEQVQNVCGRELARCETSPEQSGHASDFALDSSTKRVTSCVTMEGRCHFDELNDDPSKWNMLCACPKGGAETYLTGDEYQAFVDKSSPELTAACFDWIDENCAPAEGAGEDSGEDSGGDSHNNTDTSDSEPEPMPEDSNKNTDDGEKKAAVEDALKKLAALSKNAGCQMGAPASGVGLWLLAGLALMRRRRR